MQLYNKRMFFFPYNKIKVKNLNPGFNFEKFYPDQDIAMEFTTYVINFRMVTKSEQTFNYNFRLHNVYFIDNEKKPVFTLNKKKHGLNEWLVLPFRTSKTSYHVNPLNWPVGSFKQT